jgi:hypothetical protein
MDGDETVRQAQVEYAAGNYHGAVALLRPLLRPKRKLPSQQEASVVRLMNQCCRCLLALDAVPREEMTEWRDEQERWLSMQANRTVGADGAPALAAALEGTSLTSVNLMFNALGPEGTQIISRAIALNRKLKSVNLRGNAMGAAGVRAVASALEMNTGLLSINLLGNDIGDDLDALAAALEHTNTLAMINLEGNKIGNVGAHLIASALRTNVSITSVNLKGNRISYAGAMSIAQMLSVNSTLTSCLLSGNKINAAGQRAIGDLLETSNFTLCHMDGVGGVAVLLERNRRIVFERKRRVRDMHDLCASCL